MPSEFVRLGQVFFSLIVCAADGGMSVSVQVIKTVVYFKKIVIKIVCGYA